jgi:hypothetical protein
LIVHRDSPSFGLVQSKDLELAGARFVAFLREFEDQGTTVFHWHLASDTDKTIEAARKGAKLVPVTE